MRILQLCNKVPYPPDDGGRIAMLNMAKGFVENGCEVFSLSMSTAKHNLCVNDIPFELKSTIHFEAVKVDASITKYGILSNLFFSKEPFTASRFNSPSYIDRLIDLLKDNNFDIVHIEGLYLLFCIPIIRKYSKSIISYRAHNIEHEIWQRSIENEPSFLRRLYLKILVKRIRNFKAKYLNSYDLLVPITAKDEFRLNHLGNIRPSFVSSTGVDIADNERVNVKGSNNSLFYIGALDWPPNREGLDWFVRNVWLNIHEKHPDIEFLVAGRNAPAEFEDFLIKTKGIKYLGEVPDSKEFILSSKVMIVPLLSGSGMRIKIIEGMSLGRCILSTSIGAEGITISHKENIIIANDSAELIENIEFLLDNPDRIKLIGYNAYKFIKSEYNNKAIVGELLSFYQKHLVVKNGK